MKPARLARLRGATDREFSQRVLIQPQCGGGYTLSGSDPRRPPAEILAYVTHTPGSVQGSGELPGAGGNAALVQTTSSIKFTSSHLDYQPEEADLVVMVEEVDQPVFQVSRVQVYGTDKTVLLLVPAGSR